jgi:hypothetical protein
MIQLEECTLLAALPGGFVDIGALLTIASLWSKSRRACALRSSPMPAQRCSCPPIYPLRIAREHDGHWTGGLPVPALSRDEHGAHAGATLTFREDDLESSVDTLRESAFTFSERLRRTTGGPWLSSEDPDGNVLKLMQPPS